MQKGMWRCALLMVAGTVGAGLFGIPYVFYKAGWAIAFFYLAVFVVLVGIAHGVYAKTLAKVRERKHLLGLVAEQFGAWGKWIASFAIIGGLLITLVVYLILGARFLGLLFPALGNFSYPLFWVLASLPLLLKFRRLVLSEVIGALAMAAIIAVIFLGASANAYPQVIAADLSELFLPFGVILFALAGWATVEPVFDYGISAGLPLKKISRAMTLGTFFSSLLYLLFAVGIFGSAPVISENTLDGLGSWPFWKFATLLVLGIFAIWTSYVPIGLEIKNSLRKDLVWRESTSVFFVLLAPPLLVLLGFNNFIRVAGLAGGLFLGLQYLLILAVGARVLAPSRGKKIATLALALVFILAAVYEVYYFVVR